MAKTLCKSLRRLGLGSLSGIALYLLLATTAWADTGIYTSYFTLSKGDWAWFTLGGSTPAWFTLGIPAQWQAIEPTYTVGRIILSIAIGLTIAIWEVWYILGSEEVDWTLATVVAIMGIFVIMVIQLVRSVL